jgi:hypothetical protein
MSTGFADAKQVVQRLRAVLQEVDAIDSSVPLRDATFNQLTIACLQRRTQTMLTGLDLTSLRGRFLITDLTNSLWQRERRAMTLQLSSRTLELLQRTTRAEFPSRNTESSGEGGIAGRDNILNTGSTVLDERTVPLVMPHAIQITGTGT